MTLIRSRPAQGDLAALTVTRVDDALALDAAYVAFLMSLAKSAGLDPVDSIIEAFVQDEVTLAGVDHMMRKGLLPPADVLAAAARFRTFHGY